MKKYIIRDKSEELKALEDIKLSNWDSERMKDDCDIIEKALKEHEQYKALLKALKEGIVVKSYNDDYEQFQGNELYVCFCNGVYQLCVRTRSGFLTPNGYGKVWAFTKEELL